MISALTIQGYRGFEQFQMSGLGRVNLLVGTNNSGKTSVLESIFLLMSTGEPAALWQVLSRRGECLVTEVKGSPRGFRMDVEVRHLFSGHQVRPGSRFVVSAGNRVANRSVAFTIEESNPTNIGMPVAIAAGPLPGLLLKVTGNPAPAVPVIGLSPVGDLDETATVFRRPLDGQPTIFLVSESLELDELVGLWNGVVLTPAEALVLRALQFVDPEIERVAIQAATASSYYRSGSRGGFIVKRRGIDRPVPIGSLGDGMWRMLVMAIAITQCRGGVLLVDEIDTGLHYSVMSDMWRLIFNAAKELDVQVFATTHSYDCVYSLANICAEADERNPITVQRIEAGKSAAVPYAQNEIKIAADREIEVR